MKQNRASAFFRKIPTVIYIVIGLVIVMGIAVNGIFSASSITNILYNSMLTGIITIGMCQIMVLGELDLSSLGMVPMGGVIAAQLMVLRGMAIVPALLLAVLISAAFGALSGYLISLLKVSSIIITFAVQAITCSLALVIAGSVSVTGLPDGFITLGKAKLLGIPYVVWIMILLTIVVWFVMRYTKFGCNVFAVGGNEQAAYLEGINVMFTRTMTYAMAAGLAGLAGVLYAAKSYAAVPNPGTQHPFNAITACVIGGVAFTGGKGNTIYAVIGAVVVSTIRAGLSMLGINAAWQMFATGAIVAVALCIPPIQEFIKNRNEKRARMVALQESEEE